MKRILTTLLAVGALAAYTHSNAAPLLTMHSAATGNNYTAYTDLKTYAQADSFCNSKQGHLAVANSASEHTDIMKYLDVVGSDFDYYIGETDLIGQTYQTVTGQTFYNMGWSSSTTDEYNNYYLSYRSLSSSPNYGVMWYAFGTTPLRFICEFEDSQI